MKENQNILISLLETLHVKHTKSFANKLFNEHPHKQNMFGIVKMLETYGIESVGIQVNDKTNYDLFQIETPFVAYSDGKFVVVTQVDPNRIAYIWEGLRINIDTDEFKKSWSGVVLLVETTEKSTEPDYRKHHRDEWFRSGQKTGFILTACIAAVFLYVLNGSYGNPGISCLLFINIVGVYIGYLLILKQLHVQSEYADKICSLFKQSDCNNILDSPAAKFMGVVGWSEIGLAYFTANVLLILFAPHLVVYLALINICALPYSFWSVWYQKFKAKQWCPLCLIVQILLWAIFATDLLFGYIGIPSFSPGDIVAVACLYAVPFFTVNSLLPVFITNRQIELVRYEMNSLKMKDEVFATLLTSAPRHEANKEISKILLGNLQADTLISVYTNPHCGPCASMHARINRLLEQADGKLCIQYVFTSFGEEYETSSRFLIAAYQNNDLERLKKIYDDWFTYDKYFREECFTRYGYDLYSDQVEEELQKHKAWKKTTGFNFTPNILVNGYKLDDPYNIEDLLFFLPESPLKKLI